MIRLAICDDDGEELKKTASLVEAYCEQNPDNDISCRTFRSGYELTDYIDTGHMFDIYLLDILMPGMDGIATGLAIREQDEESAIVFLSSSDEFGVESYQARAYNYLLKPVEAQKLFRTLDELILRITNRKNSSFPVKSKNGIRVIPPHRLVYVEYRNHKCYYNLDDGTVFESITLREPFDEIISLIMADRRFVKSSISYLVNLSYIKSIEGRDLLLRGGKHLPVSRTYITELRKSFITYLLERGRGK